MDQQNVLSERASVEEAAKAVGVTVDVATTILEKAKLTLREHREMNRPKPHRDDKVIVKFQ